MNPTRPIVERLAAADRVHQREQGGRLALRSVKWLLLALVGCLIVDVFRHLGSSSRLGIILLFLGVTLAWWGRSAWWAFGRRNPAEHTARLLEDRDPSLGSKLINVLQLQAQTTDAKLTPLTRDLARHAVQDYDRRLAEVPLEQLARTRTLRSEGRQVGRALLAFVLVLGACFPISKVELARFVDPLGDHPPYSFTQLAIIEPGPQGTNVVFGQNLLIRVKSSGHRPKDLFLSVHPVEHPEQTSTFPMLDKGGAGFHQMVDDIRSNLVVFAHTKDRQTVSKRVHLGVILVPQLERAWVEVTPPAYTGLKAQEKLYSLRSFDVLAGSRVKFRLQSNRPLTAGTLEFQTTEGITNRVELRRANPNEVVGSFEAVASGRLRFGLVDVDGIPSQALGEGPLIVTHDLPPEIHLADPSRDAFVSLDFSVTAHIEANDDYGISQVRLHRALNGTYSAPKVVRYDSVVRTVHETLNFEFRDLGVRPGDVISFFAEAIDTSPGAQMARSQTVNLTIISVDDYNEFLREQSDIGALEGKYDELLNQLHDLLDEQKRIGEAAAQARAELAKAEAVKDPKAKAEQVRQLDALLARQHELNTKLNQQAKRMENFVRESPMYDVEEEFGESLKRLAEKIRESTQANEAMAKEVAQQSSPSNGARVMSPQMLSQLQQASDEQLAKLGGLEQTAREEVSEPLQDLSRLQELMKNFSQFDALYEAQQALSEQARAYDRAGQLSREDQLALRDLAATERRVGELLEQLENKLREDAQAVSADFPKAAKSGRALADKIHETRLQQLAWNATRTMLAGQGNDSFQSAERLRGEMEKLFGECNSEGGRPSPQELDRYLSLTRSKSRGSGQGKPGMKAGQTFSQMLKSRKFGRPGKNGSKGSGEGEGGDSGYAVGSQQALDVLGHETLGERRDTGRQEARTGGAGKTGEGARGVATDRADVLKGLKPVNRPSGAVQSESLIEEYSEVVDRYFKAITK